jgi:hypothetical protein
VVLVRERELQGVSRVIRLRILVLRLLRVPCSEFGGLTRDGRQRWCLKDFGHSDSCAYDICVEQPMRLWRRRAKGWDS